MSTPLFASPASWTRLLLLALAACGSRAAPAGFVPSDLPVDGVAYLNAWLLGVARPTDALGAFVPDGARAVDGTTGARTACSEWFEVIDADLPSRAPLLYGATPAAGERVRIPAGGEMTVWPAFEPSARQIAAIRDPHGLAACCAGRPDGCTSRYVGEVLSGDGKLYRLDRSSGAQRWIETGRVSGPYALRLAGNPYAGDACGAWREGVPRASHGTFVLGVSTATRSADNARADALRQARLAASTWLRAEGIGDSKLEGLTEERWCVESFPSESGAVEHLAHVLAWLPGT